MSFDSVPWGGALVSVYAVPVVGAAAAGGTVDGAGLG